MSSLGFSHVCELQPPVHRVPNVPEAGEGRETAVRSYLLDLVKYQVLVVGSAEFVGS